ncbi:MAG: hypothetical protein F6J95_030180 [Leptolyngbya sp. SIO1E4]|nr:hypothetical protein [Leptolyngbya sp. SIO1E4]
MESDDFDPYLVLLNPNGYEIAQNDDGLGSLDAEITYRPMETGRYTIRATSYSSGQYGRYTLTVNAWESDS